MHSHYSTPNEGVNETVAISTAEGELSPNDDFISDVMLHTVRVTKFYHTKDNRPKEFVGTLYSLIGEHKIIKVRESMGLFSAATYAPGKPRRKENVQTVTLLILDFDDLSGENRSKVFHALDEARLAYAAYSSFSHLEEEDKHRFRVILFPDRDILASEYPAVWSTVNRELFGLVDPNTADGPHIFFLPSCPAEREHLSFCISSVGQKFSVDSALKEAAKNNLPKSSGASTDFKKVWDEANAKELAKNNPPPDLALLEEHCAFMRHGRENAASLSEPEWRSWLSITARCVDGVKLSHEISSAYPKYSHHETQDKIDRLLTDSGPHTCGHIEDQWTNSKCLECPLRGKVKSPISIPRALRKISGELAVQRLTGIVQRAAVADNTLDKDTATQEVIALLRDSDTLSQLASAYRSDPTALAAVLLNMKSAPKLKSLASSLERALRDEAKRQAAAEKAARWEASEARAAGGPISDSLSSVLAGHELVGGLVCPPGWELSAEGIRRLKINTSTGETYEADVSHRPMLVEGRFRDIHDNTVTLALGWPTASGRWQLHPTPRLKAADSRQLVTLAANDAPVTSNNASDLVAFLDDFEAANAEAIPEVQVSGRMGWQGSSEDKCFLWGRNQVRQDGILTAPPIERETPSKWTKGQIHLLVSDDGLRSLCEGYRAGGTWEGWLEAVHAAAAYPALFVGLYASMVPPLMSVLTTLPNFIVDFCGETSMGKTTTLRFAASAWGSPEERGAGVIYSWDATRVFIERAAALTDYHPLFLDDTKRARRPEDVGRTLYDYASGIGRGRGSIHGVQRTTRAHGVLLSTGEAPATSFTNDGGTRARTLCLWGSPFGGTDAQTEQAVRVISSGTLTHYGHAGPMLVQWLLESPEATLFVRSEYERQLAKWTEMASGNSVAARAAQYVAAMGVVSRVLHEVLGVPVPTTDPLALAWQAVVQGSAESDRAADALRDVLSWAAGQQHRFYGRGEDGSTPLEGNPGQGWLGAWSKHQAWTQLAVLPTELRLFLQKQNYDAEAVLRTWDDRKWIMTDGSNRAVKVSIGDMRPRCISIKRFAADLVTGAEDE